MKKVSCLLLLCLAGFYFAEANRDRTPMPTTVSGACQTHRCTDDVARHHCPLGHPVKADTTEAEMFPTVPESKYPLVFRAYPAYVSDGFDFPVGIPNGQDYYKAQNFGDNLHLGEDWNGRGGGNTDLGDPVHAIANGLVVFSKDVCCGWGKTVRIVHLLPDHQEHVYVESVYAHLHTMDIESGMLVKRGQRIGTIGNADGRYKAHLHLEMRSFVGMSLGPGYGHDQFGYLVPTRFIQNNRPVEHH